MTREELVAAYNLRRYPFEMAELSPVHDLDLYASVDGFEKQEQLIKTRAQNMANGSLVLVYGPEGCGRSSVVNYLIHQLRPQAPGWAHCRVDAKIANHDADEPVKEALFRLRQLLRKEVHNFDANQQELAKKFMDHVVAAAAPPGKQLALDIFEQATEVLIGLRKHLVVVLENVRDYTQVGNAAYVFAGGAILVATSSVQPVLDAFTKQPSFVVSVDELSVEGVHAVVRHRWKAVSNSKDAEHPFDPNGLDAVFNKRSWTLKAIMELMSGVFDTATNGLSFGGGEPPRIDENRILKNAIAYFKQPRGLE
jgi:energy-coupling factor transporter ATP-binding protein EcfA2